MSPSSTAYGFLVVAIVSEVIGTTCLAKSEQFTKAVPTLAMVAAFLSALYFLSQSLKVIPVGIAYAIWSGVGVVLTALIGLVVFQQKLDFAAMAGIAMIVGGVAVINLFSSVSGH